MKLLNIKTHQANERPYKNHRPAENAHGHAQSERIAYKRSENQSGVVTQAAWAQKFGEPEQQKSAEKCASEGTPKSAAEGRRLIEPGF